MRAELATRTAVLMQENKRLTQEMEKQQAGWDQKLQDLRVQLKERYKSKLMEQAERNEGKIAQQSAVMQEQLQRKDTELQALLGKQRNDNEVFVNGMRQEFNAKTAALMQQNEHLKQEMQRLRRHRRPDDDDDNGAHETRTAKKRISRASAVSSHGLGPIVSQSTS